MVGRELRTRLPTFKSLLKPKTKPTSLVGQKLLLRQRRQKAYYDHGTRPLSTLREGKPVRTQQGREWTPAVVVKQHQAPRSYIVATADGTQIRRNRVHLQSIKDEPPPTMGPTWELTNDEPSPPMLPPADIGVETNGAESQPNTSQADQPRKKKPKDSKVTSVSY